MTQNFIFYQGPSMIDGGPIVAVATGLAKASPNVKTGGLVQIYIIRSDMHPIQAVNCGADESICGQCPHRGKIVPAESGGTKNVLRSCYVTLIHGPSQVWRGVQSGSYRVLTPEEGADVLEGRMIRIGAYGDPAAVPFDIWETLLESAGPSTGYTHQWRQFPKFAKWCMASVDNEIERAEAKLLGFRTFRVRTSGDRILKGEGQCPASVEMNHATQCNACMLCGGKSTNAKADITILAHGAGATNFQKEAA